MNKFIRKVTITGIDQFTSRVRLAMIQRAHPFVEWGVLLSETKAGKDNRYPPVEWINDTMAHSLGAVRDLNLSGHVCGAWARDIANGGREFVDTHPMWLGKFQRLQLNISHVLDKIYPHSDLYKGLEAIVGPRVIIQLRDDSLWYTIMTPLMDKVDILFDCSGGRGLLPECWPRPSLDGVLRPNFGYAGGLKPENLKEQIEAIQMASEGQPVWIDVESGVRTDEVLDLDKVETFLDIAAPYAINGTGNANDRPASENDAAGGSTPPV